MNAKKAVKHVVTGKTSSREAVENAISISKGPRSTTWDDLLKKDGKGWEGSKEGESAGKRKAA
jgi:hypothetical protein